MSIAFENPTNKTYSLANFLEQFQRLKDGATRIKFYEWVDSEGWTVENRHPSQKAIDMGLASLELDRGPYPEFQVEFLKANGPQLPAWAQKLEWMSATRLNKALGKVQAKLTLERLGLLHGDGRPSDRAIYAGQIRINDGKWYNWTMRGIIQLLTMFEKSELDG